MGKWEMVRLGDVCTKISSGKNKLRCDGGQYVVYGSTGLIGYTDNYGYEHDNILIARVGANCGFVHLATGYYDVSDNTLVLERNEDKYDLMFAYYQLVNMKLNQYSKGAGQPLITGGLLSELQIPLPPLPVQQKIADVLDRASALIEKRKAQIEKLDLLVKSQFIEMFGDPVTNPMGWEVKKLGDLVEVKPQNGLYKPASEYTSDGSGIPILRIDAFYSGHITSIESLKRLRCTPKEIATYSLKEADIVINRVNSIEYLGKCAYITGLKEDTIFESNMMRFSVGEKTNARFIVDQLCSPYVYDQILRHAKKAVNQASINQTDVQDFDLLVPPLSLQNKYTAFVERVEIQKAKMKQSLDLMELNYKSLMQKCFNGGIF